MATSYPGAVDALTNPISTNPLSSPAHASQHANINDAVEAIETTLGTNPQGAYATVKDRLVQVDVKAAEAAASAAAAVVSAGQASGSAVDAAASAAAASSVYDNFDDRYLGNKSTNPSVDNDGNALLTGALYFNTVDNDMKVYTGSAWQSVSKAANDAYTATAALYDTFDDRFLGAKSTPPTVDNDGNTLLVGAMYFDTSLSLMRVWTGSAWINVIDTPYSWTGPVAISANSSDPALKVTQTGAGNVFVLEDSTSTDSTPFVISATGALTTYSNITALDTARFIGHGVVMQCTSSTRPASPQDGDIIFETDTNLYFGWDGTAWASIGGGGGAIDYQSTMPSPAVDGQLWVDSDGSSNVVNANDYYTKAQMDILLADAGFSPFFLGGL